MKTTHILLRFFLIALMSSFLLACGIIDGDDDDDKDKSNIVDTASEDDRFDTLVAALKAAGLDDDLAGEGPFTVFAPTDEAFEALGSAVDDLLLPENQDDLIDLLLFHVFDGKLRASDVIDLAGTAITMLNGLDLRIDYVDDQVILSLDGNREAIVTVTNIKTSNGVIHAIDVVLNPEDATEDIVQTAIDNGFTTLVAALEAADLDDDLMGEGPLTVFAPTDDAFDALGSALNDLLLPENQDDLIDILLYHVYDGSVLEDDAVALDGTAVTMLNGLDMRIDEDSGNVILNLDGNRQATITQTNVYASNGVIHVINAVLNPDDATEDIVQTAIDNGFTTLVAALQAAELDDDLAGPGPFTVFAPTDAAFTALGSAVDNLLLPENQDALIDILQYHVFNGSVLEDDAVALDAETVTMLNGVDMSIDVVSMQVVLNQGGGREATISMTNVFASNGVIHVIDAVLDPDDEPVP